MKKRRVSLAPTIALIIALLMGAPRADAAEASDAGIHADQSMRAALAALSDSGLSIIYSEDIVPGWLLVGIDPQSTDPLGILHEILEPSGLKAVPGPRDRWLVIREPRPEHDAHNGTIGGRVLGNDTALPVSRAVVTVAGKTGRTDADGGFVFSSLKPGNHRLNIDAPGYETFNRIIDIGGSGDEESRWVDVVLTPAPLFLADVTVEASRFQIFSRTDTAQFLSREEIDRLPHLADDTNRAVQRLPGTASSDFSARINLRGGADDELLIYLDGLELIDPYHLKDLTSAFGIVDSNIIRGVDLFSGGFTAEYGNAMSGIMDIRTANVTSDREIATGVTFVNSFVRGEGLFADGRGDWLASARRGYLEYIVDIIDTDPGEFEPRYGDFLSRVRYDLGPKTRLSWNLLHATDELRIDETQNDGTTEVSNSNADTSYMWLNFATDWNYMLSSETIISAGRSDGHRVGSVNDPNEHAETVDDRLEWEFVGLEQNWDWSVNDRHLLRGGFRFRNYDAFYDYTLDATQFLSFFDPPQQINRRSQVAVDGDTYGVFASYRSRITDTLTGELGVRWDKQLYGNLNDENVSPRLNLAYEFSPQTSVKAAWGIFHQPQRIDQLQVEDGVETFFPAQEAEHYVVGIEHEFPEDLHLRVDLYRKDYKDLRPRFENLVDPVQLILEAQHDRVRIDPESAEAVGMEVTLKRQRPEGFSWWTSYTLSKVEDTINGMQIPRRWDQRHALRFDLNWRWPNWNFNLTGGYHSGWPTTFISTEVVTDPGGNLMVVPTHGEINADRLDSYSRLDMRLSREVDLKRGDLIYFFELYNIFDTENPCCVEGVNTSFINGNLSNQLNQDFWLPRVPSFGVTWKF